MLVNFIITAAVCIICYLLFLIYPIYRAIHISEKIIAATVPYEQHPLHPNKFILVAGDSTATGVGAIDNKESIAGRLGKQFPDADITNLGVSGARLKDLLTLLQKQTQHYDLIVLQIGGNDIVHLTSYQEIRQQLAQIIALSQNLSSKTIVLTAGNIGRARTFRWPLSAIITARTLHVRDIFIEEIAKYPTVYYVDLFKNPQEDPFEKDLKTYYAPDSFHLTGAGYGAWYSALQKYL
jgi:lysophospholipase L1-like esterase